METICDPCSEKNKRLVAEKYYSHRSCESVLPLDSASKDVKNSSLLSDTLEEQDYMTETLSKMSENRDENRKLLCYESSFLFSG
jgi:hypothetical protein